MKRFSLLLAVAAAAAACAPGPWSEADFGTYKVISQKGSPDIGYSPSSGVAILNVSGRPFKDLNRNGVLDPYEDWRKSTAERAADLASRLSLEEICGLMLYSSAVTVQSPELTEKHQALLEKDHIRHMLVAAVSDPATAARWSNAVQAFCETVPPGIPSNNSSDPRNYTNGTANVNNYKPEPDGEFDPAGASDISKWPREMGLAATFDLDIIRSHGEIAAAEYRALGITTALSPQADMASEPRWRRFYGTFSEDPYLCRDIVQTYCEAFQNTPGSKTGWGGSSVNCMVKHWPGGGTGEAGRDAHFGIGKYAVYPGGRFDLGLIPFTDGAFKLPGKTRMASAVMPYYTISYGQDPSGENVANGFSRYIIQDLLRDKYRYEGVVCTDWGIVNDYEKVYVHKGKPWGLEGLGLAERRLRCFEAGVDQLGGVKDNAISMEAYRLWEEKYGKESARERFELSARRLLTNIFNVGVFENPYVNPENAVRIVGCKEFVAAGYEAQLKSVIMTKNAGGALPQKGRLKVYGPLRHVPAGLSHWQKPTAEYDEYPISKELLGRYYEVTDSPEEADFAIVAIKSPVGHWGYITPADDSSEGHYQPISLQWSPYCAKDAREVSIAGGDPTENSANRSYRGYTEISSNESDMYLVRSTREAMGGKPVIVVVATERPFVPADIEPSADAILVAFGVSNNAILDLISGAAEPYGLLPCQFPADMKTVEEQCEDVPGDMRPYVDAEGHAWDFAFGLNWSGVINDARVKKYRR
ncbi:MAG: glycoside hydrolase family 3 C-terminal domain-containing protein [Bacteroidales bacterium]|nr:glycoside hydrolase family 3 C-terminal domain-containing protein [Bacteroidales bacterium]